MDAKDILILVKTYPEISTKYTETVCTGGILAETKELIRLYPVATDIWQARPNSQSTSGLVQK